MVRRSTSTPCHGDIFILLCLYVHVFAESTMRIICGHVIRLADRAVVGSLFPVGEQVKVKKAKKDKKGKQR